MERNQICVERIIRKADSKLLISSETCLDFPCYDSLHKLENHWNAFFESDVLNGFQNDVRIMHPKKQEAEIDPNSNVQFIYIHHGCTFPT